MAVSSPFLVREVHCLERAGGLTCFKCRPGLVGQQVADEASDVMLDCAHTFGMTLFLWVSMQRADNGGDLCRCVSMAPFSHQCCTQFVDVVGIWLCRCTLLRYGHVVGLELQPSVGAQAQHGIATFEREQDAEYAIDDLDGFQGLWIRQVIGLLSFASTTLTSS